MRRFSKWFLTLNRVAMTLDLVAIMAFCGLGFLASAEAREYLVFRYLYGAVAVACLAGIVALWRMKAPRR